MGYAQIGLGVLLLLPGFAYRVGAAGVVALWLAGAARFGVHHLMDYVSWLGASYYLITHGTRLSKSAIPVLYITTGFSLTWGAVEKWAFPHMAIDILQRTAIPTFGFPMNLFLVLAGWVEFGVAYLLITGVLNRFLSLVVTLLLITTSTVFGLKEVLGHWQLHATLIVFLAEGTGAHVTPVLWHKGKGLQLAFVGITLIPFLALCIGLYYMLAPAH